MAIRSNLEWIEYYEAAIEEALTSVELSGAGGRVVRERIDVLEKQRDKYLARYRAEQGTGGPAINVGVPRRDY